MSSGDQPVQKSTFTPSADQQAIINAALPGFQQFAATPAPSTTVAPFNPVQQQAQSDVLAAAPKAGQVADWATAGIQNTTANPVATSSDIFNDPGIWNPAYNTGTRAAIDAAQRPLYDNLLQTVFPALGDSAVTAGGYGGLRQGIAQGIATGKTQQAAGDVAAKIVNDQYAANLAAEQARYNTNIGAGVTQRGQDIGAYEAAPTFQQAQFVPGQAEAAVGDVQQQQQQNEINAQLMAYYAPFIKSQQLVSAATGLPGGTSYSTGNTPTPNPITGALGGAASGAALGSIIPGVGTAVGAGVGGLAGTLPFLFSPKSTTTFPTA